MKVLVLEHEWEAVKGSSSVVGDHRRDRGLRKRGSTRVEQGLGVRFRAASDPECKRGRLVIEHEVRRALEGGVLRARVELNDRGRDCKLRFRSVVDIDMEAE